MFDLRNYNYDLNDFFGFNTFNGNADLEETNDNYVLSMEVPGIQKENINIELEDDVLTISVKQDNKEENKEENTKKYLVKERSECAYERSIQFTEFEEESISAKYENGILEVVLCPKKPEVKEKKKIVIE